MLKRTHVFALLFLAACEQAPQQAEGPRYSGTPDKPALATYRLAVHPLHNPRKLVADYQPLIDYLNRHIQGIQFELEASRDYQAYEAKVRAREAEFLLPNPWQTADAMKLGYHVIAMAGDASDFKGVFVVRRDSPISVPTDLKGKVVSYPSPTALAATIMPQLYLQTHGVNVNMEIENRYVGSQESSIMNVYLKQADAGATWTAPWRAFQKEHPQEAAQMKVIWETPSFINNSVMVRDDVPAAVREGVRALLMGLDRTPEGRVILSDMETARFHAAADADYLPVREYIQSFERIVHPLQVKP